MTDTPIQVPDERLPAQRREHLRALVELDRDMTIDELMYLAGAYEDLANRKHAKRAGNREGSEHRRAV